MNYLRKSCHANNTKDTPGYFPGQSYTMVASQHGSIIYNIVHSAWCDVQNGLFYTIEGHRTSYLQPLSIPSRSIRAPHLVPPRQRMPLTSHLALSKFSHMRAKRTEDLDTTTVSRIKTEADRNRRARVRTVNEIICKRRNEVGDAWLAGSSRGRCVWVGAGW